MSEQSTEENVSTTEDTTATVTTEPQEVPQEEAEPEKKVDISACDACRAALEIAGTGLIIGGMVVINDVAVNSVMLALETLGMKSEADKIKGWISEAAEAGVNNVKWLAEFLCKKAGVC